MNGVNGVNGASSSLGHRLYVFSARTERSLTNYLSSFDEYLDDIPDSKDFTKNLAYTLGQRRTHHGHRVSIVAESISSLQEKILAAKPTRIKGQTIIMAFTGQGAQ